MPRFDPFIPYAEALIRLGHGRDWVRRNETVLRRRFESDPEPFPCPPEPLPVMRDRYGEL